MDNKKYTMADLIAEFGDGFDKMNKYDNLPQQQEPEVKEDLQPVEETKKYEPQDIIIKCKKCEQDFTWTVKEQEFYKEKGFKRPAYCKECRKKTKVVNNFHR